jgi:hypothetical protein
LPPSLNQLHQLLWRSAAIFYTQHTPKRKTPCTPCKINECQKPQTAASNRPRINIQRSHWIRSTCLRVTNQHKSHVSQPSFNMYHTKVLKSLKFLCACCYLKCTWFTFKCICVSPFHWTITF